MRPASSARTWLPWRRLRLRFVAFLVRMWLRFAWPHLYLPEAVFRKRLAVARLVLIFGIGQSFRFFLTGQGGGLRHAFLPARPAFKSLIRKGSMLGPVPARRQEPAIILGISNLRNCESKNGV